MKYLLILALCVMICSGCGKYTPSALREDHALYSQFEVDDSMQVVIKNIAKKRHECGNVSYGHVTMLEELGVAHIEYQGADGRLQFLVDLKRKNDKTNVEIYSARASKALGWESVFKTLEHGAKGLPGCPN